jgi:hypothetical protein
MDAFRGRRAAIVRRQHEKIVESRSEDAIPACKLYWTRLAAKADFSICRPAQGQCQCGSESLWGMSMGEHDAALETAWRALAAGDAAGATRAIEAGYPFKMMRNTGRRYDERLATRVFLRDGFLDRYRGGRLFYPPVLRLLSIATPAVFPYHPNWRADVCHPAYWTHQATIDHIEPVARGGADSIENFATCSMRTNAVKSSWTLDELQWTLHPPGDAHVGRRPRPVYKVRGGSSQRVERVMVPALASGGDHRARGISYWYVLIPPAELHAHPLLHRVKKPENPDLDFLAFDDHRRVNVFNLRLTDQEKTARKCIDEHTPYSMHDICMSAAREAINEQLRGADSARTVKQSLRGLPAVER